MPERHGPAPEPGLPSPIQELVDDRLAARGLRLYLKRDDLVDPQIPGNKWRKLRHNLAAAAEHGHDTLLTFGGAYSNHIRATAVAGHRFGFATVGVIRGEEYRPLNPVLAVAAAHGMTLRYLDRARYRRKEVPSGDFHLIPEGGGNSLGVRGCAELPAEITVGYDIICCASGTGTTLAGIAAALGPGRRAIGFPVLKGDFTAGEVRRLQEAFGQVTDNWSIEGEFHFGGYARSGAELETFVADFRRRHGINLDPVYEAKMMYGILALAGRDRFPPGTTLVAVLA